MALTITVTNAGRAALVNAKNTGTAAVTIAQVGVSGSVVVPSPVATALPGESKRIATISGDVVADDTIHLIVRDESASVYTVRSFALYLADGTLFAIYGQADPILEKSSQAIMLLAIDVQFADITASQLTFGDTNFLNPPATTEVQGVVELATLTETISGLDAARVPATKMVKDAVAAWLDARFGANNTGIWHPGNDGAGSGLDSDLLDGQQGSFYTDIVARLGFTPVQQGTGNAQLTNRVKIGWSAVNRLKASVDTTDLGNFVFDSHLTGMWTASNDGAGSGLDADLLDGQDGSYYSNVIARLGYTPINKGGDTVTSQISYLLADSSAIAARIGSTGTPLEIRGNGTGAAVMTFHRPNSYATFFGLDTDNKFKFGGWSAGAASYEFWHTGNDGAGSGLDADLLDGRQGNAYALLDGSLSFTGSIKATYQNGLLLKNGSGNYPTAIHRNDGSNYYILLSAAGTGVTDVWNELRPFQINLANGRLGSANGQDFSGGMAVSGAMTLNGGTVWSLVNDGAGSGMDSDMLDGLHSSQFMRNYVNDWVRSEEGVSRFHFTASGSTYARVIGTFIWQNNSNANIATIDEGGNYWGSGEVNALRFRARANGDGLAISIGDDAWIGDVNWTNGIAIRGQQDGNAGYVTFGTSGLGLGCNAGDATLRYGGQPVWWAGNDGSGSGLDADLLDGWQLQDILPSGSLAATGYTRLPNGLIMQWGTITCGNNSYGSLTFPVQFPNACFHIHSGVATEVGNGDAQANCPLPYSVTRLGASFWNAAPQATAWWFALGN